MLCAITHHVKNLILKIALPLTVISFLIFTKWSYADIEDVGDEILIGFPLIYSCRGFHTSISSQFFLVELMIDLVTYFVIWILFIYAVDRFLISIKINKLFFITLIFLATASLCIDIFILGWPDNRIYSHRDFKIEVKKTGYQFFWDPKRRSDFNNE